VNILVRKLIVKVIPLWGGNVVIYDGRYYIYNFIKDELTKLDLGTTRYKDIILQEIDGNLIGAVVYNDNYFVSFYSFKNKKFITNFTYNNIWVYNNDMYNDGYMFATEPTDIQYENNFYVIDTKNEKVMLESNMSIEVISKNGYVYYEANRDQYDKVKIYNSHLELLFNGDKYSLYKLAITDDGNLIVANNDDKVFKEYNSNGELLFTSKEYKYIGNVNDGLISLIDEDGYLKVIDYKGNEKVNFIKFTENLDLYDVTSYISSDNVELVVKDNNIVKGNKGYCRKFYYNFTTKEKRVEEADLCDAG